MQTSFPPIKPEKEASKVISMSGAGIKGNLYAAAKIGTNEQYTMTEVLTAYPCWGLVGYKGDIVSLKYSRESSHDFKGYFISSLGLHHTPEDVMPIDKIGETRFAESDIWKVSIESSIVELTELIENLAGSSLPQSTLDSQATQDGLYGLLDKIRTEPFESSPEKAIRYHLSQVKPEKGRMLVKVSSTFTSSGEGEQSKPSSNYLMFVSTPQGSRTRNFERLVNPPSLLGDKYSRLPCPRTFNVWWNKDELVKSLYNTNNEYGWGGGDLYTFLNDKDSELVKTFITPDKEVIRKNIGRALLRLGKQVGAYP